MTTGFEKAGFKLEGTGGGCTAFILRLAPGRDIYVTDGDLSVPEDDSSTIEAALIDENCTVLEWTPDDGAAYFRALARGGIAYHLDDDPCQAVEWCEPAPSVLERRILSVIEETMTEAAREGYFTEGTKEIQ